MKGAGRTCIQWLTGICTYSLSRAMKCMGSKSIASTDTQIDTLETFSVIPALLRGKHQQWLSDPTVV